MKKRVLVSIAIVIFALSAQFPVLLASDHVEYVDVLITLNGPCVSNLLPSNYTDSNSRLFDKNVFITSDMISDSVSSFVNSYDLYFDEVYQGYSILMRGFSCRIQKRNINKIQELVAVSSVLILPEYKLDLDTSVPVIKADQVWDMENDFGEHIDGTGTKIGIIDSGLDYTNPDLGGGAGPGRKVIEAYDYADNLDVARDGQNHGTHVAGICAADGKVKGVAPKANLVAFKVFSSEGRRTNVGANIIKALEQALLSKCDVVNLSLGSIATDPGTDADSIYNNAVDAGMVICASSGNNGARAPGKGFPIGYPSSIESVISVAASDDSLKMFGEVIEPDDVNIKFEIMPFVLSPEWIGGEFEIVDCGYGNSEDDFAGKNLKGKIALIQRGGVSNIESAYFKYKVINAGKAGASACIIYNNRFGGYNNVALTVPDEENNKDDRFLVPTSSMSNLQGEELLRLMEKGTCKILVSVGKQTDSMAYFSSSGPSSLIGFKPDVAAPGVNIYSTLRTEKEDTPSWGYKNGTSMACPHVSGAVALIKQAYPDASPIEVKSRLMGSATLLWNDMANEYLPLTMQGAGRIDIKKAIETESIFSPPGGAVIADYSGKAEFEFSIHNLSSKNQSVELSYYSIGRDTEAEFEFDRLSIKPRGIVNSTVKISCTNGIEGILEGVIFAEINGEKIHLPLMIQHQSSYLPPQLSYLRVTDNNHLDVSNDDSEVFLTFKLNYGSFITSIDSPGDFITSTFAAAKIGTINDEKKELGTILYEDYIPIGYYHIPWNGRDIAESLIAHNGKNRIQGQGIRTIEYNNGEAPTVIQQRPAAATIVNVEGSPLLETQNIGILLAPEKPGLNDDFEIRIYLSETVGVREFDFELNYPSEFIEIVDIHPDRIFGDSGRLNFEDNKTRNKLIVHVETDEDMVDWHKGTAISILAKMIKTSDNILPMGFLSASVLIDYDRVKLPLSHFLIRNIPKISCFDLNDDNVVNIIDFAILSEHVGSFKGQPLYESAMDFDLDGRIDFYDVSIFAKRVTSE